MVKGLGIKLASGLVLAVCISGSACGDDASDSVGTGDAQGGASGSAGAAQGGASGRGGGASGGGKATGGSAQSGGTAQGGDESGGATAGGGAGSGGAAGPGGTGQGGGVNGEGGAGGGLEAGTNCEAQPEQDSSCGGNNPPHWYACTNFEPSEPPSGCTLFSIGDLYNSYCCP